MPFSVLTPVTDVIIPAKFYVDPLKGFWEGAPPKVPFPILFGTTVTTVLHYRADCDARAGELLCRQKTSVTRLHVKKWWWLSSPLLIVVATCHHRHIQSCAYANIHLFDKLSLLSGPLDLSFGRHKHSSLISVCRSFSGTHQKQKTTYNQTSQVRKSFVRFSFNVFGT